MIELFTKDCYGCDRKGRYNAIRDYVVAKSLPLSDFVVKRIQLNPDWVKEAEEIGVELPFLRFTSEKEGTRVINYDEWLKELEKPQVIELKKKRSTKKKTASIKKEETKTIEVE